jgi:hypothetical protein
MLVDRNLIIDLIALESERENRYRHPPLYIVALFNSEAFRREEQAKKL